MTITTVQIGSVVRYHGSIASEHYSTFYVSAVEPSGRYELTDRDYPAVSVLRHVRRASFTPTGEHIDVCVCGHDAHNATHYGTCGAHPCECPLAHDNKGHLMTTDDPNERSVREQYADELRADPFYLPGVDDYDNGWTDETDDEETP